MWSFFSRDFSKDFPYVLDNQPEFGTFFSVWSLYKAKKKASNDLLSIFAFDSKNRNETEIEIARQSLKRLKTLRHPTILTYVDSLENEKNMYLVTESVQPLDQYLKTMNFNQNQKELISLWGIYQITKALSFLNNDAKLLHNNINLWSVFVNQTEDWKLAGVEYMNSLADNSVCANKIRSELLVYEPPEKYHMQGAATANDCSDVWGLGCLIWEIFNGQLNSSTSLKNVTNIPEKLVPIFREITNSKPKNRPNPNEMLQKGTKPGSYFDNSLINIMNFLDEIQIADRNERNRYFDILNNDLDKYPKSLCQNKILPKLIYAYDYGEAGSNILLPLFKISRTLDESQFQKTVLPCLVKLFKSNDRTTRSRLLSHLEYFVEFIPKQLLNDTLFAEIANGFLDSNLTIREQTITAIVCLAPKLNSNNLNNELLRYFANLQLRDENGGIRTNVTICLGKIAEYLEPKSRQKVLISAFIRAMKDPFAAARNSGIVAFAATQQYYLLSDIAQRILPALSQLTIDPDENVRDSAFRTLKGFLAKLEECSKDPTLKENLEAEAMKGKPNLANVAANWTGWAMNAVTAKFHKSTNADISHISANANNSDSANKKQTQNEIKIPASLAVPKTQPALQPTISKLTLNTRTNNFNNDFGDDDYDRKSQNSDLIQWDKEDWGEIETSDVTATTITGTFDNRNSKSTIIAKNRTDIIDDNGNDNDDAWNLDW